MRKGTKRFVGLFLLFLVACAPAIADTNTPPSMPLPRFQALGGFHAALGDDFSAMFTNPAGFVDAKEGLSIAEITPVISGPVFSILSLFSSSFDISKVASLLAGGLRAEIDLGGPFSFGYVGKGMGFGLFNRTYLKINAPSPLLAQVSLYEDILLTGGYAFSIDLGGDVNLDIGILAKGFIRGGIKASGSALGFISNFSLILGQPFEMVTGLGIDLGLKLDIGKVFSMGLVAHDLYTPTFITTYGNIGDFMNRTGTPVTSSGIIPMTLNFGLAYFPELGELDRVFSSIKILLDYNDIIGLFRPMPRNAILNLGFGIELTMLDILSLRAGLNEGLLSAGLGLNLGFCILDFAMYGRELGLEPGERPIFNMSLSMQFRY